MRAGKMIKTLAPWALGGLLVVALGAQPALALSVDQVLALRQAGVSDQVIQKMIQTEMAVAARGGMGRYQMRTQSGKQIIVYYVKSPQGMEDLATGLDLSEDQLIPVSLALGAQPTAPAKPRAKRPGGKYALHLTSHRTEKTAQQEAAQLKKKGVSAWVKAVDLPGKGRWYRVMAGSFASKGQAEKRGKELRQAGRIGKYLVLAL